jgi:hypothetical protein
VIPYTRAGRRAHGSGSRLAVLVALPLIGGLTIGTAVAQPGPNVKTLTAAEAEQLGSAISIVSRQDLAVGLAEVRVPGWTVATGKSGVNRVLAIAPGGGVAAIAGQVGPGQAPLIIVRADGSQLRVGMAGLLGAAFAPDATWLAVIDGAGSLWRIDASSGEATPIAEGPFLGSPAIDAAGSILALRVASVEAPFVSRLVRLAADGSQLMTLTDEELVYGVQPLTDGTLAVIAHRPAGTLVIRVPADGAPRPMADLGPDAVNVSVASTGAAIAWERAGEVFLRALPAGQPQRLTPGGRPRFAPDGQALLVDVPTGTVLMDLGARTIATFSTQVAFDGCPAGCAS